MSAGMYKILEYLFYLSVGWQLIYYGMLVLKYIFVRQSTKVINNHHLPVSVIICARNEAEELQKNLSNILEQDYDKFEVIVVNDGSTDLTQDILSDFQKKYEHLKVIHISPEDKKTAGKKFALKTGIDAASYEYLLMTDADCCPVSRQWIAEMMNGFDKEHQLVLGISPYRNYGKFLHNIVDYETLTTMIQYIGWALWKHPYMGVGRNIAYTKTLYNKVGGFESHMDVMSGDDDLFVQQAIKHTSTAVCLNENAYTYSDPPQTFKEWWRQKVRHYSVGGKYNILHQSVLGMFLFSKLFIYVFIWIFFVTNTIGAPLYWTYLLYLSMLYLYYLMFLRKSLIKMNWLYIIILDIVFVGTILAQGLEPKLMRKTRWA